VIKASVPRHWEVLTDAALLREALICRLCHGVAPSDTAGLYITDEDIDRIAATLPGLVAPPDDAMPSIEAATGDLIAQARAGLLASSPPDDPVAALGRRAGLTGDELIGFALLLALELHPARRQLLAYIQDNVEHTDLQLQTAVRLPVFDKGGPHVYRPGGRLDRLGLVARTDASSFGGVSVHVPAELMWALTAPCPELVALADGLEIVPAAGPSAAESQAPADSGRRVDSRNRRRPVKSPEPRASLIVAIGRGQLTRRRLVAEEFSERSMLWIDVATCGDRAETAVSIALAIDALPVFDLGSSPVPLWLRRLAEVAHDIPMAFSLEVEPSLWELPDRPWIERSADAGPVTRHELVTLAGHTLLSGHRLSESDVIEIGRAALYGQIDPGTAVRRLGGAGVVAFARRIRPRAGLDDLVLPDEPASQLRELIDRCRFRGVVLDDWGMGRRARPGVLALFAGPSGTGKTLAAEVVAAELGLDMLRIDLSSLVSKYIGETEKQIDEVFASAERANAVLVFDEADSVFGKRSEVKDSHDRYANLGVSYLLQRVESHVGVTILTSNLARNIDEAFRRRIDVQIELEMPGPEARAKLWRLSLPSGRVAPDVDIDRLAAELEVSGGTIHNVALTAAFLAASDEVLIGRDHLALAVRRELQKLGRLVSGNPSAAVG
jgi:hypothetical protein